MREPGGPLTRNESDRWVVTKALWGLIGRNVPLVAVRIARTSIPDASAIPKLAPAVSEARLGRSDFPRKIAISAPSGSAGSDLADHSALSIGQEHRR